MSGLQARGEDSINGVDVREQGNTLRVATNTPHLVSLGTGRLSTAVTLHPIKQGRVTIGSDPTCDIYVVGSGVSPLHCRVENSHGVVTLYPVAGTTLLDSQPVHKPCRLSQGSMLTIGRSNYLRFNHPAEAMLMKSVLPTARRDHAMTAGYVNVTHTDNSQCYQPKYKNLEEVDQELDISLKELSRTKPPVAPKDERTNIMSKVSKFEYYAKQNKIGRSQFYTNETEISPKVFSANSLTVNTPAKDVLGGKALPNYMKDKVVINDSKDPKNCSYQNVAIRNNTKIGDLVKNFDEKLPKKINNDIMNDSVYGKINTDRQDKNIDKMETVDFRNEIKYQEITSNRDDERSYKDTSFEISRNNQEIRSKEYARTKQEFLRNNQVQENQERLNQGRRDETKQETARNVYHETRRENYDDPRQHFESLKPQNNQEYSKTFQERIKENHQDYRNVQSSSRHIENKNHTRHFENQSLSVESSRSPDRFAESTRNKEMTRSESKVAESTRNKEIPRGQDIFEPTRAIEMSRSVESSRSKEDRCYNGIGIPQYSPVYGNQYEWAENMRVKPPQKPNKMTAKSKREPSLSHTKLVKIFVNCLKKNTVALQELKHSLDKKHPQENIDRIIDISANVNDKLDVVHKLRNDIKIYKTVNTILTNHYVKKTKESEDDIERKIIKLETQIRDSYNDLKKELSKMAAGVAINNVQSPVQNSNVFVLGNNVNLKDLHVKNEIYNGIIKKIDKLFCSMAYQERVKEEEKKEAEMERLEEILDIFTEYQKQLNTDARPGMPITPTEKRSHNKIITNGSLPRSVAFNNPNFVQTSDGYYKFETSHNRNESLPRNVSSYENFEPSPKTPEVSLENCGRMDEIGIPVFDEATPKSRSNKNPGRPVKDHKNDQARKDQGYDQTSPIGSPDAKTNPHGSPYENVYMNRPVYNNLKPKSPNTNSPRTRIKTSFAHKNLPSPQYFIFPTPPPSDRKPNFDNNLDNSRTTKNLGTCNETEKTGIEKQLSLEEDIPMIDDLELANDLEFRYSTIKSDTADEKANKSFEDVKKELMADIPELEAFEKDLNNKRERQIKNITNDVKNIEIDIDSLLEVNIEDLKSKYQKLKEERKKLVTEIHDVKCRMTEITAQEDDILRELEMEKALIKGEYDSEIAILKIEQKKRTELSERAKRIEDDIKQLRGSQDSRQSEMRDRVEVATMKVERLEKDVKNNAATLEELQNAQDILDNESKIYEDLEFQHLEEESELLSSREDIQNEITLLTKKIDAQKTRILTLKSEASNNLTSALDETKILHTEYVKHLTNVEELTAKVQSIEKELKPIVAKLNEIERAQSPDSAFYTDQTRAKSGEFGYSPPSSDEDIDIKISNFEEHAKEIKEKFNSIDQMSQSMTVDIEKRVSENDSPKGKEKKGFWERNFDSLKRKKKPKSPEKVEKVDIMTQSLNENLFYNNGSIENETAFERFGSLRNSKKNNKGAGPIKSNSSSKIPTFAALGKIIKKDSFGKKNDEEKPKLKSKPEKFKSKSLSPDKTDKIAEENEDLFQTTKVLYRKSCGDEPNVKDFEQISDSGKIPSQDDIDRISKVTIDAPILSSEELNSLGKRTLDSLMEIERRRVEMLEEQGCQMIENEREKISELKRRAQDETKKLWDQKVREKSVDSGDFSLTDERRNSGQSIDCQEKEKADKSVTFDDKITDNSQLENADERSPDFDQDRSKFDRSDYDKKERSVNFDRSIDFDRSGQFDRSINCFDQGVEDSSMIEEGFMVNSAIFEESSGCLSSSIEELQVRNSRTESTEDEKRSDDSRPLSHASDFSRDNILSLSNAPRRSRRGVAPYSESQRPLTRYLPVDRDDFDLRRHVESAGHQIELCPYVTVTSGSCRGYLHKLGAKFHTWSKRWFVFDRETKTFVYYWDKSEKKPRGGAYFQVIEEVYLDHGNTSKSPSPQTTFIVKTRQRRYYLMAPSGEAARIWIDAIFTGAQGYTEYLE